MRSVKWFQRNKARTAFIRRHYKLCTDVFTQYIQNKLVNWNSDQGRELVLLARKELGYSEKTISADIFFSLFGLYRAMEGEN